MARVRFEVNGKMVSVDGKEWEKYIKTSMKDLEYTDMEDWNKDEIEANARKIWMEDEGYEVNAEQEALEKASKVNKVRLGARAKEVKPATAARTRTKKQDLVKENIITEVAKFLEGLDNVDSIEVTNTSKYIEFTIGDEKFTFNLVRNKKAKKK